MVDKIIKLAVALTLAASATGRLPQIVRRVQIAQFKLLDETKTSTWGHLMIIDTHHGRVNSH